jgi:hypothetical protein
MFRRWSRRILIFLPILFIGIPTLLTVFHFGRTAFYLLSSSEVRLEEFCPALPPIASSDIVLQSRVLPRSEYWRVAVAMPPVPDASAYIIEIMCYDPHHRVVMRNSRGNTHQVEICFECLKMRYDSPWVGGIPLIWHRTLRSFFEHYGMRERSTEEYSKLRRIHT